MLTNPATGGQHWFHGTPHTFGQFRPTSSQDWREMEHPAWNAAVGHHFTSLHETASHFITDGSGAPNPKGWHIHAKLGITNPKHYDSELDMLHHAAKVCDPNGRHVRSYKTSDGKDSNVPVSADEDGQPWSTETHLKLNHPDSPHKFREHLISQGHDGITYGNEFEGPKGHTCAIAFHHDQIKIADRHAGHQPGLPESHVAKKKHKKDKGKSKNHRHLKHKPRVVHHAGWPGYHPWCTGFYFGGGYIGHDGHCPAHHGGDGGAGGGGDYSGGGDGGGGDGGGGDGGGGI